MSMENDNKNAIRNWSVEDRPRERMLQKGAHALSDTELLTILIGSGNKTDSAMDLARKVLAAAQNSLAELGTFTPEYLINNIKGIGPAKAILICTALELGRRRQVSDMPDRTVIRSSKQLGEILMSKIGPRSQEVFYVFYLNNGAKILFEEEHSQGTLNSSLVDIRLVLKKALECKATRIAIGHNHPSGTLAPSEADVRITKKILEALKLLDMTLMDHVIVTQNSYYSFIDQGLL
jgi:DNA repair protein RadC